MALSPGARLGPYEILSEIGAGGMGEVYDVTYDGRFIMIRRGGNGGKLRAVVNWTNELRRFSHRVECDEMNGGLVTDNM